MQRARQGLAACSRAYRGAGEFATRRVVGRNRISGQQRRTSVMARPMVIRIKPLASALVSCPRCGGEAVQARSLINGTAGASSTGKK